VKLQFDFYAKVLEKILKLKIKITRNSSQATLNQSEYLNAALVGRSGFTNNIGNRNIIQNIRG